MLVVYVFGTKFVLISTSTTSSFLSVGFDSNAANLRGICYCIILSYLFFFTRIRGVIIPQQLGQAASVNIQDHFDYIDVSMIFILCVVFILLIKLFSRIFFPSGLQPLRLRCILGLC